VLGGWQLFRGLTTELIAKIGSLLFSLGEPRLAQRAVERALQDPRPTPPALLAIAQAFERTNRLAEARTAIARLESAPQAVDLRSDLLLMKARIAERDGHHEEAIAGYRDLLAGTAEEHRRHHQLFPLAKALDAAGRYEEAYETLEAAHRSQVEYLRLTSPNAAGRAGPPLRITEFGCEPADVAAWNAVDVPAAADSPIFIVGFPRSGTTLLEQTLDAHPALKSMDETRCLHQVIDHLVDSDVGYPERLSTLGPNRLREAREMYWALARRKVDLAPGQRLVDKNPMNLLGLPAIRLLFPSARILLAIRHPCDVILSCYMQHFRAPEFALLCSDLSRLGSAYTRAFDFWYRQAEILAPKVIEICYETFVTDFEPQVRAVAAFLELSWMDAMLQPGEHARRKGFISTPSYTQVIQPVNQKSIGRWQHYARHFEGVIGQVRPYLDRWNYMA
jgi:tetratricopeptide (TPR) repeat protein